ncbi:hypothetical protein F4054_20500, partial [Candidatus Poribacteria bacterium]|nr:hypothetical protein [Candidatus Poribacteria bacterium]
MLTAETQESDEDEGHLTQPDVNSLNTETEVPEPAIDEVPPIIFYGGTDNTNDGFTDNTDDGFTDNTDDSFTDNTDNTDDGVPDNTDDGFTDNTDDSFTDNTDNTDDGVPDNTDDGDDDEDPPPPPPISIPTTLVKGVGDQQSGRVSQSLGSAFVVQVLDQNGAPMRGVTVRFSVAPSDGSLSATSVSTDANGEARTLLTLGGTPGTYRVTGTISGLPSVTFTTTATAIVIPPPPPP